VFRTCRRSTLDGFGILEPLLDERTRFQLRQFGTYGILLVFMALWFIPPVGKAFFDMVIDATIQLDIPHNLIAQGFESFMFWRQ
jgi:hypothetical protein